MQLPGLDDLDFSARRVLLRADLNVPLAYGQVSDAQRIRAVIPTIQAILAQKPAQLVVCSHLGDPKGRDPELSLAPVARELGNLMGRPIKFLGGPLGVEEALQALPDGGLAVLENLRYEKGEKAGDDAFADALAAPFERFVLDAFGALHRAHASISLLPKRLPAVAGLLVAREIAVLENVMRAPKRPFYALLGGSKLSTKLGVVKNLLEIVDGLMIGGGMAYTFLKARGEEIGRSLVDDAFLGEAKAVLDRAQERGVLFLLPRDHVVGTGLDDTNPLVSDTIPEDKMALDIGPLTRQDIIANIGKAASILWNGPVGAFEYKPFSYGTQVVTLALQSSSAQVVVGGGDSAAAVARFGKTSSFFHISTGGGASLEFMEGKKLPGIAALEDART